MHLTKLNWNHSIQLVVALKLHCCNKVSEELIIIKTKLILHATYQEIGTLTFLDYLAQTESFQIIHCTLCLYRQLYGSIHSLQTLCAKVRTKAFRLRT